MSNHQVALRHKSQTQKAGLLARQPKLDALGKDPEFWFKDALGWLWVLSSFPTKLECFNHIQPHVFLWRGGIFIDLSSSVLSPPQKTWAPKTPSHQSSWVETGCLIYAWTHVLAHKHVCIVLANSTLLWHNIREKLFLDEAVSASWRCGVAEGNCPTPTMTPRNQSLQSSRLLSFHHFPVACHIKYA